MIEKLDFFLTMLIIFVSVISSVVTVLISYSVFRATIILNFNTLRNDFDNFENAMHVKIKELDKEDQRISLNQQAKITSIQNLEKKFDQFREDHIREIGSIEDTVKENTKALHELAGYIKKQNEK